MFIRSIVVTGKFFLFLLETLKACIKGPIYVSRLLDQINFICLGSIPLTVVIGLVTGLVMTLQFGAGLSKFGGSMYVPAIVSISLVRELSPVFTSLLVGGRISSGMAAEIGSMKVTDQVEALRALGTMPISVLVVPRLLASLLALPLLTMLSLFTSYIGGYLISSGEFDMGLHYYHDNIISILVPNDVLSALLKALVFAGIISTVSCFKGLTTKGGTKGVGDSTKWAVVISSLLILISDFFLSKIFIYLWG